MGRNKSRPFNVPENRFHLPAHSSFASEAQAKGIIDTHTHLLSTFSSYRLKYPNGSFFTVHDFVRGFYRQDSEVPTKHSVDAIVDVWCEAPVTKEWKEVADSALTKTQRVQDWGGMEYWFVMGVHPHNAKAYTDEVESAIMEAMKHPRCVGWGEMGLDYHYMNSPRDIQQSVFRRQLKCAVKLNKPLTIHTREADEDVERILKEEVPKDHKIHVHCFTDTLDLARNLLDYFPNLFIGVTGVVTFSSNENTSAIIRNLAANPSNRLRILLETDAPYMVPSNIYASLPKSNARMPFSHSGMIPWTAEYVARVAGDFWDTDKVLHEANENAKFLYGI